MKRLRIVHFFDGLYRRRKSVDVFSSRLNDLEHIVNVTAMKIIETRFSSKKKRTSLFPLRLSKVNSIFFVFSRLGPEEKKKHSMKKIKKRKVFDIHEGKSSLDSITN